MTTFRELYGAVYILENSEAQRVKVGMTINDVASRLRDANDMWLEHKLTCQICGGRRLAPVFGSPPRIMPRHVVSGVDCPGGNALPLEADDALAKAHLEKMNLSLSSVSGRQKISTVRRINTLEGRLGLRRLHSRGVGKWQINTVFYTKCAEQVELLSHELLNHYLDRVAPFGEVYSCSTSEAQEAVNQALRQLGLLDSARQE